MEKLYVGSRKGLLIFTPDAGDTWSLSSLSFEGVPVSAVFPDPRDGRLYVALNHGHFGVKLHRSEDGGQSWEEVAVPTYPERPSDWVVDESLPGTKAEWNTEQVWIIEAAGNDTQDGLWAGTIPGGLFFSADSSESWELNESLWHRPERLKWFGGGFDNGGIHSVCVDPRDSNRLLIGVSCGGAWESKDKGETWSQCSQGLFAEYMPPDQRENPDIQDPHRMVMSREHPDSLWIQHHNGIFKSSDGARSWQHVPEAGPSTFGFAVATHPQDPNIAWFVPARKDECRVPVEQDFVVTRTRDGGQSFEVLSQGLPPSPAFDLVYRHALDVNFSGDSIALGSTTGGLWVSKNQGDQFELISTHLPPIYCLRFGK